MYEAKSEILELNHYYPFGMRMAMHNSKKLANQHYLYNGKEKQEETGWLDYGVRQLDISLGRWMCMDPLAEERYSLSGYNYCSLNPISRLDSDGMLDTRYEDENGNLLLNTSDGSDEIVKVSKNDQAAFLDATTSTIGDVVNSPDWNNRMKGYLSSGWLFGVTYNSLGKEFAQEAFINYVNKPSIGNWAKFGLAAIGSRWTTPEVLVG
ncbi:MAG: hypothetical protein N4A49_02905, partial [Marinifilaceae bacterium]|nr:hypothetical protein [Marinifilaceae bacterium]